jgi:hypothetical protein
MMCYHHMRFIILENVSLIHGMVTHHLETNFWKKKKIGKCSVSHICVCVEFGQNPYLLIHVLILDIWSRFSSTKI